MGLPELRVPPPPVQLPGREACAGSAPLSLGLLPWGFSLFLSVLLPIFSIVLVLAVFPGCGDAFLLAAWSPVPTATTAAL